MIPRQVRSPAKVLRRVMRAGRMEVGFAHSIPLRGATRTGDLAPVSALPFPVLGDPTLYEMQLRMVGHGVRRGAAVRDRSSALWGLGMDTWEAAAERGIELTEEIVAEFIKHNDSTVDQYHKYSWRENADDEYRRIAAKTKRAVEATARRSHQKSTESARKATGKRRSRHHAQGGDDE